VKGTEAGAVQSLDYAFQLIRQKKGGQLDAFLLSNRRKCSSCLAGYLILQTRILTKPSIS